MIQVESDMPSYDNSLSFILIWKIETGIDRYPLEGEWATYKYKIGQMDIFEDGGLGDQVIDELDKTLRDGDQNLENTVQAIEKTGRKDGDHAT